MTPKQAIESLQQARLEWGMVCSCTCEECDRFYKAISAIEDSLAAVSQLEADKKHLYEWGRKLEAENKRLQDLVSYCREWHG
jgi:hypothetical protein